MAVFYYTYRITNIKNGKRYIGKRQSTIKPEEDLGICYFSSSHDKDFIKDQINNPSHYKYEILKIFDTPNAQADHEIELHERYNVGENPMFYNKVKQSPCGFDHTGHKHSDESKKKMSKARLGKKLSDETKAKMSAAALGKKKNPFSDSHRKKISEANFRRKLSDESKAKISASTKGKKKKRSAEHIENLKAAQKRRWETYYKNKLDVSGKKN